MQACLNKEFCKFRIFAEIFPESWKRREPATWLSPWPLTSRATFPESTQDCDHSNLSSVQLRNCYENDDKMKTKLAQFNLQRCSGISRKELTQLSLWLAFGQSLLSGVSFPLAFFGRMFCQLGHHCIVAIIIARKLKTSVWLSWPMKCGQPWNLFFTFPHNPPLLDSIPDPWQFIPNLSTKLHVIDVAVHHMLSNWTNLKSYWNHRK